ncbi:hypothetical protein [Sphingomonas sp. BAUL-RG-20F-R05-02]|uniref:hypothetical protein n=1 Tax=Sphingomonas sp. BAUL-RG-20F-R05-02 TaxID=2914830 RepID=UPI001F56C9EE|nr:hypothetical protein [Sphingomonas sp. BAUL-RG-20F-R05-02]
MDETYIPWGTYELHVGCNRYDVDVAVEAAEHHSGIKGMIRSGLYEWIDDNRDWLDDVATRKIAEQDLLGHRTVRIFQADVRLIPGRGRQLVR